MGNRYLILDAGSWLLPARRQQRFRRWQAGMLDDPENFSFSLSSIQRQASSI
jgi:hypothetical protein